MREWLVIICDPKGADFAWAGRLPGVLYFSGDEAVNGLAEACGEMDERRGWVARHVWSGEEGADEEPDLLKISGQRSEERRVGEEGRPGGARETRESETRR